MQRLLACLMICVAALPALAQDNLVRNAGFESPNRSSALYDGFNVFHSESLNAVSRIPKGFTQIQPPSLPESLRQLIES